MLMDVDLMKTWENADRGDAKAIWQMDFAYAKGKGVPIIDEMTQYYLLKLADCKDEDIPEVCFGTLYFTIGDNYLDRGHTEHAHQWFVRSYDYIKNRYYPEYGKGLIGELELNKYIIQTSIN